jgi:hypothetical protein
MDTFVSLEYRRVVDEICGWDWAGLTSEDMVAAACAYYYFSIQFRESLETARAEFPSDEKLIQLEREECDTANLSPWPGVALPDEKMNHDEFMRRALMLETIPPELQARVEAAGEAYLASVRHLDRLPRALSISSYEDGGLEAVFRAMLQFDSWNSDLLRAFRHFLIEHVRFDSDSEAGHGALSRHLAPDDRVLPLWVAFREIFLACVPALGKGAVDLNAVA